MTIMIAQPEQAEIIPDWVIDLESFRRWAASDEFPESGQYSHLGGSLWVDSSMERIVHNQIKSAFTGTIFHVVEAGQSGEFYPDRMLLTNVEAGLSTEPDAMFVSFDSLDAGKLKFINGDDSIEVLGTPDLVLEIVSPNSRKKDTQILPELYHRAGIPEYWLVEPQRRTDAINFQILRLAPDRYVPTESPDGWVESKVLGKSFRLARGVNRAGNPSYKLEYR